jgi:chromosome segregation protein
VLGSLLEAVLVDDPGRRLGELADFAQGRVALMSRRRGDVAAPAGSLAARVRGPAPLRALLARVHAVDDAGRRARCCRAWPTANRRSPAAANGSARAGCACCAAAKSQQGALAREAEIKQLRAQIEALAQAEARTTNALTALKDSLLEAEQLREDAQRSLYLAHRGVSELAGQLQGLQSRLETRRRATAAIDAELATLGQPSTTRRRRRAIRARACREAVGRMSGHENERQQLDQLRRSLGEAREAARNAAREARENAHKLALTLESQRASVLALTHRWRAWAASARSWKCA